MSKIHPYYLVQKTTGRTSTVTVAVCATVVAVIVALAGLVTAHSVNYIFSHEAVTFVFGASGLSVWKAVLLIILSRLLFGGIYKA